MESQAGEEIMATEQEEFEFRRRLEEEQAAIPPPDLAKEEASFMEKAADFALEGDANHKFDITQIPKGGAFGAGIGGGIGLAVGGPPGAAVGAGGGFVLGVLGALAEETIRTLGGSELLALAGGMASGGATSLAKSAAGGAVRAIHPSSAAYLPRPVRAAVGLGKDAGEEGMTRAERLVRRTKLGERPPTDFTATEAFDATQETLKKALPQGTVIPAGKKVSDFTRDNLYSTMDDLRTAGQPFAKTNSYQDLLKDLDDAAALKEVTKDDIKTIKQLAANQLDLRPGVVGRSNQSLLNLAQNGGKFNNKTGEAEKLISDKAQDVLAKRFNQYFDETGKGALYADLKSVERAEILAKATDEIPLLIMNKMRPQQLEEVASNIKATPEGKAKFVEGLGQYFGSLPQGRTAAATGRNMMNEFERLAPALQKTGLLTSKQLNETQRILANIPKDISAARWKEIGENAILSSITAGFSGTQANINSLGTKE
jgi:hypothetical protein